MTKTIDKVFAQYDFEKVFADLQTFEAGGWPEAKEPEWFTAVEKAGSYPALTQMLAYRYVSMKAIETLRSAQSGSAASPR